MVRERWEVGVPVCPLGDRDLWTCGIDFREYPEKLGFPDHTSRIEVNGEKRSEVVLMAHYIANALNKARL